MIKLGFIFIGLFFMSIQIVAQETVPELKDEGNAKHLITAQEVDPFNPVPYVPMDFTIPLNPSSKLLKFTLRGGDGGWAQAGSDCKSGGGDGAVAEAEFIIGNDAGQLPAGSEIRFVIGIKGKTNQVGPTNNAYGGGGGGTAVLARFPGNTSDQDWIILAVAGGGGGAYQGNLLGYCVDSQPGQGGRSGTSGGNGGGTAGGAGGTNGNGGDGGGVIGTGDLAGGGGGAKSNGGGNYCIEGYKGQYEGGLGGYDCDDFDYYVVEGGWGFGGGGAADDAGGGGGGYSGGGGGGVGDNGGGGSSYVNTAFAKTSNTVSGGSNSVHQNGEASYQFEDICATTITGFEYVNAICSAGETGRVQLIHGLGSGNICSSELYFTLSPDNGWSHLGNGLFKSLKAGTYTASVVNSTENIVVDTYTFTVGVTDEAPTAVCKDVTINLIDGSYSNPNFYMVLDDGSSGPCDISLAVTHTSFDCDDIGVNTVFMQVIGSNNLAAYCSSQVTIEPDPSDAPVAKCVNNRTINLDNGAITLVPADIDNGSTIGTCVAGMTISPSEFDCDDIGEHTVTLRVTASPTTYAECTTTVTITDNNTPTANCKPQITLVLDDNGVAALTPNEVNNISISNNCTPLQGGLSQYDFDCTHVGDNQVTFTVYDGYGRTSSCSSTVTVEDNTAPVAVCQDITIGLDENGEQTITADQLDGGSTDLCDLTFSTPNTTFTCADIGTTSQILTVTDQGGNQHSCTAQVTIADNLPPKAICSSYELQLLFPEVQLSPNELRSLTPLSTDNCSGTNLSRSIERSTPFTCADVGIQEVTIRLTDEYNNSSTCTATLTVIDRRRPSMACRGATIQIGDNGSATLTTEMVDAGSSDYCGIDELSLDKYLFDCDDIGTHSVTLTATDINGNIGTCTANIEIEKTTGPIAKCQDLTVSLDENGYAEIEATDIDNGSSDVCGLSDISLDQSSFDCGDIGIQALTLTASNYLGNSSTCQATVSVVDEIDPNLTCPQDMTVNTDQGECGAYVNLPKAAPADNCGIKNLKSRYRALDEQGAPVGSWSAWVSDHSGFFESGSYQVQWRAKDNADNKDFCSFTLQVIDEEEPDVVCKDLTIKFNGEAIISIPNTGPFDEAASFDACGTVSFVSQSLSRVSCDQVGQIVPVQVVGIDPNGNTNNCTAQLTVSGMPCGFEATDINCEDGASATYDPVEESFSLMANNCEGYPDGQYSLVTTELCRDGEIIAKVASLSGDGRAGVIMMESQSPDARFVSSIKDLTPRTRTEYRLATGGGIGYKSKNRSGVKWVRIVRQGNKFKTYTSTNGSYWRKSHTIEYEVFADCIQVGMLVYSKNANEPVTAVFENVKVSGDSPSALEQVDGIPIHALQGINEQGVQTNLGTGIDLNVAPNPFADQTQIEFTLPIASDVTLEIYNLHGQRVQSLENAMLDAGTHRYQWDGQSSKGESLPTGIYLLRLRADKKWITTKVSLVNR